MKADLHDVARVVEDALNLVPHRTLKAAEYPVQCVEEPGHPVYVGTAAALVNGHDVHASTISGRFSNINQIQLIIRNQSKPVED
jgi:hypothetical protein